LRFVARFIARFGFAFCALPLLSGRLEVVLLVIKRVAPVSSQWDFRFPGCIFTTSRIARRAADWHQRGISGIMQQSVMTVEPGTPIGSALALLQEHQADLAVYVVQESTAPDRKPAQHPELRLVAHRDDLLKMVDMGLDRLPVSSIAIPEISPLLHIERAQLRTSVDYSRKLSAFFPVYFVAALYELQSLMLRFNIKAYVIGGITRDLLLFNEKRLKVKDVDITVEGDAIALAEFLMENSRNFKLEEQYAEFGTAKVRYKDTLMFDFASTRQEVYPACGVLPVVVNRGVPLVNDIIRRDFTVNALAFSVHELGKVLDYSNGIRDIQKRELRVLHPASFFEDPSRILRAMKFCARFDFNLAEETRHLLENFLNAASQCRKSYLKNYKGGGERIKQELKSFLGVEESAAKSKWVRFFMASGCSHLLDLESDYQPDEATVERLFALGGILPEIGSALSQYVDQDFNFDAYLCVLCRDMEPADFQHVSLRLGLTRNEREFVEQYRKLKDCISTRFGSLHEFSSPAEIYDIFRGLHIITVTVCLVEIGLQDRKRMKTLMEAFLKYKRKWEPMRLELDGNDLIELGVPEGKLIGQLLDQLLHAKLVGQTPDRLAEVQYIRSRLAELKLAQERADEEEKLEEAKFEAENADAGKSTDESSSVNSVIESQDIEPRGIESQGNHSIRNELRTSLEVRSLTLDDLNRPNPERPGSVTDV